jgi:CheY-like chemotaxis protein
MSAKQIILIVEDDETEQYVLKCLVEKFDYDAHVVASGEEALKAMGITTYSAVLMDITLPGIDGYECTTRIREMESGLHQRTPIIAITARSELSDRIASMEASMDDYMSKPFNPED